MSVQADNNSAANKFSYNKLIWPIFTLLTLLIFKGPIEKLILGSDDVAVEILGVKIKMAKSDIDELTLIQKEFENEIQGLNDTINKQNEMLEALAKMNKELEQKAHDCPEVEKAANQFSKSVEKIKKRNDALQSRANQIGDKKLFKVQGEKIERKNK